MKIQPSQPVSFVAGVIEAKYIGDGAQPVSGFNEIHRVEPGDLTFVDIEKYYKKSLNSAATVILINKEVEPPPGKSLILSDDPFRDYNRLTEYFQPRMLSTTVGDYDFGDQVLLGRHVVLGRHVTIGKNTEIGHNVVIGSHVTIGENVVICPNATICDHVVIGDHVCIQSGAVIGGEAFYYKKREYGRDKMLTKGRVILHNHVDIGANTTIDRGVSADTVVGEYTKIDNQVMIGHDTVIGKRCVIAAQVGIAGVCNIEDDVILWGQVGISSDVTIGQGAIVLAASGVSKSLAGGKSYFGAPAKEAKRAWRELATLSALEKLAKDINEAQP